MTKTKTQYPAILLKSLAVAAVACLAIAGCGHQEQGGVGASTIQNKGSDTMVNVAQAWAEAYKKVAPGVEIEVSGGGSGVGIAALIRGTIDIANASRNMKPEEIEQARTNTGKTPKEFIVGYDALAVYVHKDNPIDEISIDQLADIFAEGGKTTKWSELGANIPAGQDEIIRVSRQSSSGTYEFFREHVLNKKDFKLGSRDMNGSKEVVELVAATPGAIGYSGMGYNEPGKVKMLRIAPKKGEPGVSPSLDNALTGRYPIARSLQVYTLGEPTGELKNYVDWILTHAGQKVVQDCGYVPLPPDKRKK
ncbi:MAG TPA: phosphate ABC transporter substrate-binding protein [Verrucomicrobiae bacterium]|nr:phosphate ABC transporter substrate-binding protein [Verrucomicrobiae bacterium]